MCVGVVRPDAQGFAMEKKTLNALGEGLRKAIPVGDELPQVMQAKLLTIAAKELKPVFVVALSQLMVNTKP
jgi:hypothetical protein